MTHLLVSCIEEAGNASIAPLEDNDNTVISYVVSILVEAPSTATVANSGIAIAPGMTTRLWSRY